MKVVLLAGGIGTRLAEETEVKPKPMVEIGGEPMLWHIMKHYSHFGFLSVERARQNLGWAPLFTLEQGLDRTIAWYRDFLGAGKQPSSAGPAGTTIEAD